MLERLRDRFGADEAGWLRPVVLVPAGLALALVLLLLAGVLLTTRAAAVGRAQYGDTGPVLVGADLPADGTAGSGVVTMSAAATTHPQSAAVRDLIQRHIDARNDGDLTAYRATLVPGARVDEGTFEVVTRTMRVGSIVVQRIDPVGDGELVVPVGFVTTQDPADAPADVRVPRLCWQVSAVIETGSGSGGTDLRLIEPRPGSQLRTPC